MPMLMTLRMRLPVWPFHAPLRTRLEKSAILSSTAWTCGTTFSPSTTIDAPFGARSATCRTARFSVMLIFSPRNIASIRVAQAGFLRQLQEQLERLVGDAILRVIEVDARASAVIRSPRLGSSAKSLRRCSSRTFLWCASRAFHAGRAVSGLRCRLSCLSPFCGPEFEFSGSGFPFCVSLLPQPKPSEERIGVVAGPATGRELFQFLHVASAQNDVVGFEGGDQAAHHVRDIAPPFLLALLLQSPNAHVILVGALLVRQMAQFHRLDDAIHNHGGTEAGSQAQEEHLAALVASQACMAASLMTLTGRPNAA